MSPVLLLTLLGAGLALARIERLEDRVPGFAWEQPYEAGDRYFTQEELLSSLHEKQVATYSSYSSKP